MSLFQTMPLLTTVGFVAFVVTLTAKERPVPVHWGFPAALSAMLLVWSLEAVFVEGPLGFWAMLSQSFWGNQVWFDLLLAFGIGLSFLVPLARAQGMRVGLWVILTCLTGSIGLLAMYARVIYLRDQAGRLVQI